MQKIQIDNKMISQGLLIVSPLLIFWGFNHRNIPMPFYLLLGLIVLPYILKIQPTQRGNLRYAIPTLLTGLALLFFRSSSLYYFSAVFLMFFAIEKWQGKLNTLPLFLALLISPVANTIVYIWSFPIRLEISKLAGKALQLANLNIEVHGNTLLLDGNIFSVDPACIGLKMVTTSLVLCLVILAHVARKRLFSLNFVQTTAFLCIGFLLSIVANFVRLLTLILFHILPENPMHDIIGLLSMGFYVLLPFYFLSNYYFQKKLPITIAPTAPKHSKLSTLLFIGFIGLEIINGFQFLKDPIEQIPAIQNIEIAGFKKEITPNGILELQNDSALIYIKPPVQFFQGSHDPRFCWQGSGYEFSNIKIQTIGQKTIYTAILDKESDKLFTAWWYQSPNQQTPYEWDWRWENLRNKEQFYLMNFTTTSFSDLKYWVNKDNQIIEF